MVFIEVTGLTVMMHSHHGNVKPVFKTRMYQSVMWDLGPDKRFPQHFSNYGQMSFLANDYHHYFSRDLLHELCQIHKKRTFWHNWSQFSAGQTWHCCGSGPLF